METGIRENELFKEKLLSKKKHVDAVQHFLYWIIDQIRVRAKEHDSDKISALERGTVVDTKQHHRNRHHFLHQDSDLTDVDIVDIIEFLADNITSALYESEDGVTLTNPNSSPRSHLATLDNVILATAKKYRDVQWRMVEKPNVWLD